MNLRPFGKKASPLIASLSVLSIKFHFIHLIRHAIWILVCGHHSIIDDFSCHHSIKGFKHNNFIKVLVETGLFIILRSHR